jgi:hypothetical protein
VSCRRIATIPLACSKRARQVQARRLAGWQRARPRNVADRRAALDRGMLGNGDGPDGRAIRSPAYVRAALLSAPDANLGGS